MYSRLSYNSLRPHGSTLNPSPWKHPLALSCGAWLDSLPEPDFHPSQGGGSSLSVSHGLALV